MTPNGYDSTDDDIPALGGPPRAASYVIAVLIPAIGLILAIVALARGYVGPGLALLITSALASYLTYALLVAA